MNATRNRRPSRKAFRPRLDLLEARQVLSTLVVTSTADSGPGTLRDDVAAAASGDTITFAPYLSGKTITLTSGRILEADKSLSILGPPSRNLTISGGGKSGIFGFDTTGPAVSVKVAGLTLANGFDPNSGAAIDSNGASLTLVDDLFLNNAAGSPGGFGIGGAVNDLGPFGSGPPTATITIADSKFINNTANNGVGGAIQAYNFNVTVSGSLFDGNGAGLGGALTTSNGSLSISDTTVTNSKLGGGVAFFAGASSTLTVADGKFSNNASAGGIGGGAIQANGGAVTVSDTLFTGNIATNDSFAQGGAILAEGSTIAIDGSRFENNAATGPSTSYGGAVFLLDTGTTSITNTTFRNNLAQAGNATGGAIDRFDLNSLFPPLPTFTISGSTFEGNRAVALDNPQGGDTAIGGAASIAFPGKVVISDTSFRDNRSIAGPSGSNSTGVARAGALQVSTDGSPYSFNASLSLTNTTFTRNSATGGQGTSSGGIGEGGALVTFDLPVSINGGSFVGNAASAGDGGANPLGFSGALGGAIRDFAGSNSTLTINGTSFVANTALGGNGVAGNNGTLAYGGAIYGANSTTLTNTSFIGNTAIAGNGGKASSAGGTGGNGGDAFGGAIGGPNITIQSSLFVANLALGGRGGPGGPTGTGGNGGNARGGAVDAFGPLTVLDSQFVANFALGGPGGSGLVPGTDGTGLGGAIADGTGPIVIKRTKFAGNRASTAGNDVYGPYTP